MGDCPVSFIFPDTSEQNEVPYDPVLCSIQVATLELSSRGYRTDSPSVYL